MVALLPAGLTGEDWERKTIRKVRERTKEEEGGKRAERRREER